MIKPDYLMKSEDRTFFCGTCQKSVMGKLYYEVEKRNGGIVMVYGNDKPYKCPQCLFKKEE